MKQFVRLPSSGQSELYLVSNKQTCYLISSRFFFSHFQFERLLQTLEWHNTLFNPFTAGVLDGVL